jgi:aminoglycoside 3-N-acetyltransferase I
MRTRRLTAGDRDLARELFGVMASVFEEESDRLSDSYLDRLLGREDFWSSRRFPGTPSSAV